MSHDCGQRGWGARRRADASGEGFADSSHGAWAQRGRLGAPRRTSVHKQSPWVFALLLFSVALAACSDRGGDEPSADEASQEAGTAESAPETSQDESLLAADPAEQFALDLYFPGQDGRLWPERRQIDLVEDSEEQMTLAMSTLLAGPESSSLWAPLPDGVKVGRVYALGEGTYVLDLQADPEVGNLATGSQRELLAVYSMVNTLVLAFEPVQRLLLVWNGRQPDTFAGHLDTSAPLQPNLSLIRRLPGESS